MVENDGGDYDRVRKIEIGFTAVPTLITGKVDAAVSFWNAEGVALRERGVETREFRVDDYGAPRYPELVLVVTRETLEEREELVDDMLDEIAGRAREPRCASASDRRPAGGGVGRRRAAGARPARGRGAALRPPVQLDRAALEGWARFDERFGILREAPDVEPGLPAALASGP